MSVRGYIPIEKEMIPEKFEIPLGNINYIFGVDYNKSENIFTIDLFDSDNEPIVIGETLVLNERLWRDIIDDRIPSIDLVPMDESGKAKEITFHNLGVDVFCIWTIYHQIIMNLVWRWENNGKLLDAIVTNRNT